MVVEMIFRMTTTDPDSTVAMRLLDLYAKRALHETNDEGLMILNTVITGQIRENLEGKRGSFNATNYIFALAAHNRIAILRREECMALKKVLSTTQQESS